MTAIALKEVRKSFGPTEIIRGVNLTIRKGERHALIGPNGAGKTTMFHILGGQVPPSATSSRFSVRFFPSIFSAKCRNTGEAPCVMP